MTTPVSFPIAKLLKEKEFDLKVKQRWCIVENIEGDKSPFCQHDCGMFNWNNEKYADYISAPTISDVIVWFYEKHGIWISVSLYCKYIIETKKHGILHTKSEFNSPTEAYETAIEYVLKNLI